MLTPDEGHLDRRIAQEAGTLAAHGWMVDIYPAVDPSLKYEAELPPGVRLMANPRPATRPAGPRRALLRRLKRSLTRVAPPMVRLIETVQYRRRDIAREIAEANIVHLLRLGRYDVVFAHDVPVMPLAVELKTSWGACLVSDLHEVFPEQDEYFTSEAARRYWRSIEGAGLAASDGILCVNPAVVDYVEATYAPSAPIAVIHNAVPYVAPATLHGSVTLRTLYPIPDGARVLLFAGSLRPYKGLEVLIDGFAEAELHGWVLAILGDGPLRGSLDDRIARRGLTGRVFVGQRASERDLIHVAASADVALLPYQAVGFNYQIATPNKLFEYIQARLPIVTTRLPEIERIVAPLGTAAYVDFSSARSMARGIEEFVRNVAADITSSALEQAARDVCWEREEGALLRLVAVAVRH